MAIQDALRAACRELAPGAHARLATGVELEWSAADILALEIHEGADAALLPGAVLSSAWSVTLANPGHALPGRFNFKNAVVQLYLDAREGEATHRAPLGTFIVDAVSAPEQAPLLKLSGADSVPGALGQIFEDGMEYPCTLAALWAHLAQRSGYAWSGEVPNGDAVIDGAPAWGDCSLRQAMGYAAAAAGCFVQLDRTGRLCLERCWQETPAAALSPSEYMAFTGGFEDYGPVTGLRVVPVAKKKAKTQADLILGGGTVGERLEVKNNPLFMQGAEHLTGLAQGMLTQVSGMRLSGAEFRWRGDPAVRVGTRLTLTDTSGASRTVTVTRQTLRFERGFSMTTSCALPNQGADPLRAITPEGGLNAAALVGAVDGALLLGGSVAAHAIQAGAITTEKLEAGSVTADKLAAGSITAEKLAAGVITADKLAAGAVEAGKLAAGSITAEKLAAGAVTADKLAAGAVEAASLDAVSARLEQLNAGTIEADELSAALAEFVSTHAQLTEADLARVRTLMADALGFSEAVGESATLDRVAAQSSLFLSAVVGDMVVKGDDDRYYRIAVQGDGTIATEDVTTTLDGTEIAAAETRDGRKIVETEIAVGDLDGENVRALHGVFQTLVAAALEAGQINAVTAMIGTATIPELYATSIRALSDDLDLSANESITLRVNSEASQAVSAFARLRSDGLHVGAEVNGQLSTSEVLIDSEGVSVKTGASSFSRFASSFAQFGHYRIFLTTDRGLAFSVDS